MTNLKNSPSLDEEEVAKFSKMADEWWSETGKFKPLHKFNPTRISFIKESTQKYLHSDSLSGLSLLDIGCGGGLLSEPMTRLGASVTAIDASDVNINIAKTHAKNIDLEINYLNTTTEELAKDPNNQYDIVLNMEVVEHVADVQSFLESCYQLVKPGGMLIIATLNRTLKSYALAIVGAEYILRWLPQGTHDWNKFLKPSEIAGHFQQEDMKLRQIQGVSYTPIIDKWKLSNDIDVNYMMVFVKEF